MVSYSCFLNRGRAMIFASLCRSIPLSNTVPWCLDCSYCKISKYINLVCIYKDLNRDRHFEYLCHAGHYLYNCNVKYMSVLAKWKWENISIDWLENVWSQTAPILCLNVLYIHIGVTPQALDGQNIYNGCCTLHIDLSKLSTLTVKYNNDKSRWALYSGVTEEFVVCN